MNVLSKADLTKGKTSECRIEDEFSASRLYKSSSFSFRTETCLFSIFTASDHGLCPCCMIRRNFWFKSSHFQGLDTLLETFGRRFQETWTIPPTNPVTHRTHSSLLLKRIDHSSSHWTTVTGFVKIIIIDIKPMSVWERLAAASLVFISTCGSLLSSLGKKIIWKNNTPHILDK